MNNLQWLYGTNDAFHDAVCNSAAEWLGSTSENFADTWLRETHHEPDEACLLGQHMDADGHEERIETQRQTIDFYAEELRKAQAIADKYREDSIAAQKERDEYKEERDELKAEQLSWPTMLQYKDACSERDAYRELCGRMRKMANEILVMEVDEC